MAAEPILPSQVLIPDDGAPKTGLSVLNRVALRAYQLVKNPELSGSVAAKSAVPADLDPIPDDTNLVLHMGVDIDGAEHAAIFYHHENNLVVRYTGPDEQAQVVIKRPAAPEDISLLESIAAILGQENSRDMTLTLRAGQDVHVHADLLRVASTAMAPTGRFRSVAGLKHMSGVEVTLTTGRPLVLCVDNKRFTQLDLIDRIANDQRLPAIVEIGGFACSEETLTGWQPVDGLHNSLASDFEDIKAAAYEMLRQKDRAVELSWNSTLKVQTGVVAAEKCAKTCKRFFAGSNVCFYYIKDDLWYSCQVHYGYLIKGRVNRVVIERILASPDLESVLARLEGYGVPRQLVLSILKGDFGRHKFSVETQTLTHDDIGSWDRTTIRSLEDNKWAVRLEQREHSIVVTWTKDGKMVVSAH